MKIDSEEKQPHLNGKIYENEFGYHTNSEVYANKGSDITELSEMPDPVKKYIYFKTIIGMR